MKSKKRTSKIKRYSKNKTYKNLHRKRKGGEFPDYNLSSTIDTTVPSFDNPSSLNLSTLSPLSSTTKMSPPIIPPRPLTLRTKAKESCKLCNKLNISNEYDLCKRCDTVVFSETDKLRSDKLISELSTIDALKGVFELTVVEILKKGSYHGLPGFTLLRNKTNNDPTLSTTKKAYLNALINISLNHFYRLADSVLNYNQYTQLNGPKADIKTPGDITRVLEQVSGLLNEMNKTYNTQVTANDQQIINYMKNTIISDLNKNPLMEQSIKNKLSGATVTQLQLFLSANPDLVNDLSLSYDTKEFIKVFDQLDIDTIMTQSSLSQPEKKDGFLSRFFKR